MAQADASHSGRLLLRMPKGLHAALAERADAEQMSLNQLIVGMLTNGLSGEAGSNRVTGPRPARPPPGPDRERDRRRLRGVRVHRDPADRLALSPTG